MEAKSLISAVSLYLISYFRCDRNKSTEMNPVVLTSINNQKALHRLHDHELKMNLAHKKESDVWMRR